jgi:hypothetical protein
VVTMVKCLSAIDQIAEVLHGRKPQDVLEEIKEESKNLFFYIKLPESLKAKLQPFADKVSIEKGCGREEVDHITSLFVPGPQEGFTPEQALLALETARKALEGFGSISTQTQGWAYFDQVKDLKGTPATALVCLLDSHRLTELHYTLWEALRSESGVPMGEQNHGYISHATIAYMRVGERVSSLPFVSEDLTISEVWMSNRAQERIPL